MKEFYYEVGGESFVYVEDSYKRINMSMNCFSKDGINLDTLPVLYQRESWFFCYDVIYDNGVEYIHRIDGAYSVGLCDIGVISHLCSNLKFIDEL